MLSMLSLTSSAWCSTLFPGLLCSEVWSWRLGSGLCSESGSDGCTEVSHAQSSVSLLIHWVHGEVSGELEEAQLHDGGSLESGIVVSVRLPPRTHTGLWYEAEINMHYTQPLQFVD